MSLTIYLQCDCAHIVSNVLLIAAYVKPCCLKHRLRKVRGTRKRRKSRFLGLSFEQKLRDPDAAQILTIAKIFDVDISTEPGVVSQIPPIVVGVIVNDNLIGVPQPSIAVGDVIGRYGEVESAEPETRWSSAFDPE